MWASINRRLAGKEYSMLQRAGRFALLVLAAASTLAFAAEEIAVVVKLEGEVRFTPPNSTQGNKVQKGQVLKHGDKLETGPAAYCAIKFLDDKSLLRIKENSSCVIEGKRKENAIEKSIFVEAGSFFLNLFKQKEPFKVTTPTSVASVKGTAFWVLQFRQSGETRYVITDGALQVDNNAGKVLGKKGQTVIALSRNRLPEVRLTQPGDIPFDEADASSLRTLDFEFNNSSGQTKILRIQLKTRD